MTRNGPFLSAPSTRVLEQMAEGRTYEQILALHPDLTYLDIFAAAREALTLAAEERADCAERLARIKQKYPRAYERWSATEDAELARLAQDGMSVGQIAEHLQRQPSAIRSRLARLSVTDDLP